MTMRYLSLGTIALLCCGFVSAAHAAPIHEAAKTGDTETVLRLVDQHPTMLELMDEGGATALYYAAWNGHTATVQSLLGRGADANTATPNGLTPLHWAALEGHLEICSLLLDAGADVNARSTVQGNTPLHEVWGGGHAQVAALLIERGADVDATEKWYGMSILHYALAHEKPELVRTLLAHGADPYLEDKHGRNAYQTATGPESAGVLKLWTRLQEDQ